MLQTLLSVGIAKPYELPRTDQIVIREPGGREVECSFYMLRGLMDSLFKEGIVPQACPACEGTGQTPRERNDLSVATRCEACQGTRVATGFLAHPKGFLVGIQLAMFPEGSSSTSIAWMHPQDYPIVRQWLRDRFDNTTEEEKRRGIQTVVWINYGTKEVQSRKVGISSKVIRGTILLEEPAIDGTL